MKLKININRLLLVIFGGIGFLSCNSADYLSSIDLSKNHSVSVWDIFSDVKVIKLETTDHSLMSNVIFRVEYHDSRYYILDRQLNQIFCFDDDGRFVYKINARGKGRGEYNSISDIAIDKKNQQLVALDPAVQRVHFFDLKGNFLISHDIKSDKVYGLIRVYPMQDSLLLLTSLTHENLLIYSLKENNMVYSDYRFNVPSTLHTFSPIDNVYYFDTKVLFLAPLSREIVDFSAIYPKPYYTWCFGRHNNSEQQIDRVLEEITIKQCKSEDILVPYQVVGKNKILTHHIIKTIENQRFRIGVLEFDNDFKFVIVDKKDNQTFVFKAFKEGVRLPFYHMQSDRAIALYSPEKTSTEIERHKRDGLHDYYQSRNFTYYSKDILNDECKKIIENHNPIKDNPYLVVYKFKE